MRLRAVTVMCAVVCLVVSCTRGGQTPPEPALDLAWSHLSAPSGLQLKTVTGLADGFLVGGQTPGAAVEPRLFAVRGDRWAPVALSARSYYAFRARWRSVAASDDHVLAIADAPGGAHSNPRWTVWRGTMSRLGEEPQTVETFGGWGSGGLVGAAFDRERPVIVGSWSAGGRLSPACWRPRGPVWMREVSSDPALASQPNILRSVRTVGTDGAVPVLAGSATVLGSGTVTTVPTIWRRAGNGSWTEHRLPVESAGGQVLAVRCSMSSCLAVGVDGARAAVWRVDGTGATRVPSLPPLDVDPVRDKVFVVATAAGEPVLAVSSGVVTVMAVERDGRWSAVPAPPGRLLALAAAGRQLMAITQDSAADGDVWHTVLPT